MSKPVVRKFVLCQYKDDTGDEIIRLKTYQEKTLNNEKPWMNRRDLHNFMNGLVDGMNYPYLTPKFCYDFFIHGDESLPVVLIY